MAKRIYLSPERRPNPHAPYWGYPGVYEHDVCCEIAEYCKEALIRCGFEVKIARPEDSMEKRVAEGISWGANYYMPIHTNAATAKPIEGTAQGPTVLRYGKEGGVSDRACKMVYNQLMAIYPRKTRRGVYAQNAFYEIRMTPMVSVYPEIAFHDNGEDAKWIMENKKEIGIALCKGVCQWFGVNYVEPPVTNPNTGAIEEPTVPKSDYDKVSAEFTIGEGKELGVAAIEMTKVTGLADALGNKVDKETGKGLSSNDFTDALLNKLNAIADGAQVNVIDSVSDEFEVSPKKQLSVKAIASDKITGLQGALDTKLEQVKVAGTALTITDKAVDIPAATAAILGVVKVDDVTIGSADGVISVKAVSTDLFQQGTDTLIWNGGTAQG